MKRRTKIMAVFCTGMLLLGLAGAGETQPSHTQTTYAYEVQELHAQRDGLDIYGEIYIPQGAGEKMPAVIISHGFGGTHTVGQPYARALAEHGYVAYYFDFCGGSASNRSDGSPSGNVCFYRASGSGSGDRHDIGAGLCGSG